MGSIFDSPHGPGASIAGPQFFSFGGGGGIIGASGTRIILRGKLVLLLVQTKDKNKYKAFFVL